MKRIYFLLLLTMFCSLPTMAQNKPDPCVMVTRMVGEADLMILDGDYAKALKLLRGVAADPETQGCSNLRLVKAKIKELEAKVSTSSSSTVCSKCNGSGIVKCYACDGTGTVKVDSWDESKGSETCKTCAGKGKVACITCNGTGKQ